MNKTKIEWADLTWNPVTGCKRGCSYCYARKINDRFKMGDFTEIKFHHERLREPLIYKKPSTIFVGSMSDLCYWSQFMLDSVINICAGAKHHEFMFLTKDPGIYEKNDFPINCWLGCTITGEKSGKPWPANLKYEHSFFHRRSHLVKNKRFISIEPLLGPFYGHLFDEVDLIIVGAMTGPNAIAPDPKWIASIQHDNIFYKDNIKQYM